MLRSAFLLSSILWLCVSTGVAAEPIWNQWRGPGRDGQVDGPSWPTKLAGDYLKKVWRVPLEPSYSGPIVGKDLVFVTETKDRKSEVVRALDRKTGKERWAHDWTGAMTVPFFAGSNGSWIRATPALDGDRLYVAGMRDVLACLDAKTGKELWRVDFVKKYGSSLPAFGFVSSPLVDEKGVYVQAGASVVKLDKQTGKELWRALKDRGGMMGSAFSSPILATLAGKKQLVVQTRDRLAGVDLDSGAELWTQKVPAFRGMNILTPLIQRDTIFTATYGSGSFLYKIDQEDGKFSAKEVWKNNAQGYMSSPVVIAGHVYLHMRNQRFTCIDLETGKRVWTSEAFGKYASLVAQGDRILALDQRGELLLIKSNPEEFELLARRKISDEETWAHLAVVGDELFIRELKGLSLFRWRKPEN